MTSNYSSLANTANTLSCGLPQVPERVIQVVDERKKMTDRVDDVERELAGFLAKEIVKLVSNDTAVLHKHRTDDAPNPLGFLTSISTALISEFAALSAPPHHLVVLSSSPSRQTAQSSTIVLVLGSDEKRVREVGDALKSKLSVKGGGKGVRWSGKFAGVWLDSREGEVVRQLLN